MIREDLVANGSRSRRTPDHPDRQRRPETRRMMETLLATEESTPTTWPKLLVRIAR
jgi:hypothetical protein